MKKQRLNSVILSFGTSTRTNYNIYFANHTERIILVVYKNILRHFTIICPIIVKDVFISKMALTKNYYKCVCSILNIFISILI